MIFTLSEHENGVPFMDYFSYFSPRRSSARSVITRRAREILWNERCAAKSLGRSSNFAKTTLSYLALMYLICLNILN